MAIQLFFCIVFLCQLAHILTFLFQAGGADGEVVREGDVAVQAEVFLLTFAFICLFAFVLIKETLFFLQDGLGADRGDEVAEEELQAQVDIVLYF